MKYHFNHNQKGPEPVTKEKNEQVVCETELSAKEQRRVMKGHCYESYCRIGKNGEVWNPESYAFLNYHGDKAKGGFIAPALKERARLYRVNGLFEVVPDKIYQVRGYDTTNLTLVRTTDSKEGTYGWVVINCLHSKECTYEALKLADACFCQRGEMGIDNSYVIKGNIKAIILTEPDEDCYGGVKAVLYYNQGCKSIADEENYNLREDITIIAGERYVSSCMKEDLFGGNVKNRLRHLAYGKLLDASENGKIMAGMGQGTSNGTKGFIKPTAIISRSCEYFVRGLRLQFQMSNAIPGTFHLYFPDYKALWMSHWAMPFYQLDKGSYMELGNLWDYYMEAYESFQDADVLMEASSWPCWNEGENDAGESSIQAFIKDHASLYKSLNDEVLYYANMGYSMEEVADLVNVPKEYEQKYGNRVSKDECGLYAKAVFTKYFGWCDGNPVHFKRLTKKKQAMSVLKYFREDAMDIALSEFENGNYQEVSEVMELALEADPGNEQVRYLLADCLEQLGYQSDYAGMRNSYLEVAYELRHPRNTGKLAVEEQNEDFLYYLTPESFLERLSISYHSKTSEEMLDFSFYIHFALEEHSYYQVLVCNGCLLYRKLETEPLLHVMELTRNTMQALFMAIGKKQHLEHLIPDTENKELNRKLTMLFGSMTNLREYRGYSVVEDDIRRVVIDCKNMLLPYYENVEKATRETEFSFSEEELHKWQETYYPMLVKRKRTGFQNMDGIHYEGVFRKYDYFLFLYQCFRYLARYCKDTSENRNILKCILILEPYLERFDGEHPCSERTVYFNVFDFHSVMDEWQNLKNAGIIMRSDGKITGCELVQALLEGYRYLYES